MDKNNTRGVPLAAALAFALSTVLAQAHGPAAAAAAAEDPHKPVFIVAARDPVSVHFTFGMRIRNEWSLWDRETVLVRHFVDRFGLGHADDISGLILSALWANVQCVRFDIDAQVGRYLAHWERMGVDPVSGVSL